MDMAGPYQSPRFLIFAISTPKSGFWMLRDAFEVREAASSVGGERPDDGPACGRRGTGRSPANPTLLAAFLTSKASPSIQNPDFGVDIAKIRNLGLRLYQTMPSASCNWRGASCAIWSGFKARLLGRWQDDSRPRWIALHQLCHPSW